MKIWQKESGGLFFLLAAAAVLLGPSAAPGRALAFSIGSSPEQDVRTTLQEASRWSAEPYQGTGLHDGIQVGVAPQTAQALGASTPAEVAAVNAAIAAAFDAWENPVLQFDVVFDTLAGEITLAPELGGPVGLDAYFGLTGVTTAFEADRLLTNGQRFDGYVITAADISLNAANILYFQSVFPMSEQQLLAALQRLVMHELGHAIGLGHPTIDPVNLDTDLFPLNPMIIDPADPFADVIVSPNRDLDSIMSGLNYGSSFEALFFTSLRNDDARGRDVLYPVPEPGTATLLAAALAGLGRGVRRASVRA